MNRWSAFVQRDAEIERLVPPEARTGRAVGFLAGFLGFLAALALALALAAGRIAADWSDAALETATLQIFAADADMEAQARAALDVLRATPGIRSVRMVEIAEQRDLLEPWLGTDAAIDALPLPLMIDVALDRSGLDRPGLEQRLAAAAPAAVFDDHADWQAPLAATAAGVSRFAFMGLAGCTLALAAALVLAVRAAVASGAPAIATLRLVGARDGYIARAFTRRLGLQALAGATAGTAAAMLLLTQLPRSAESGFFLAGIGLAGWQWLLPVAVPLAAWAVARLTAAGIVRRTLRRWT